MPVMFVRMNESYDRHNAYLIDVADDMEKRHEWIISNEMIRGEYVRLYDVSDATAKNIFKAIKSYNIDRGGGGRFYNRMVLHTLDDIAETSAELTEKYM